jgi:hypothetical protein
VEVVTIADLQRLIVGAECSLTVHYTPGSGLGTFTVWLFRALEPEVGVIIGCGPTLDHAIRSAVTNVMDRQVG